MPDSALESYVGEYALSPEFIITVSKEDKEMKAQASGQSKFDVFPKSENEFYLKAIEVCLAFNKNDNGKMESLTLFQGGQAL